MIVNKLRRVVYIFMMTICFLATVNCQVLAQQADSVATSAIQARGDAPDENIDIDTDENLNVKGETIAAPSIKGGETGERAASRFVNYDNWTDLYIKTYVNGRYQGTVAPWGNLKIYISSGRTYRLYARADFTDGSYIYWGPRNRYFGNSFNWRLNN